MSKRLQVLLDEAEYRRLHRYARKKGMTVAALVRESLQTIGQHQPRLSAAQKMAAVRAAMKHQFPTADIETMNAEIAMGYHQDLDD